MGKREHLVPQSERSLEERKKIARMGGKASGEAKRRKKTMRELAEVIGALSIEVSLPSGKKKKATFDEAVIMAQYQKAIKNGNVKSAFFLAQLKGQLEQNINVSSDQPIIMVNSPEEKEKIEKLGEMTI